MYMDNNLYTNNKKGNIFKEKSIKRKHLNEMSRDKQTAGFLNLLRNTTMKL